MSEITAVIEKCHWCGGVGHSPDKCDWVTDKEVAAEKRGRAAHVAYRPEEPRAWFVKDYADGWVYFDNEADALREVSATGATMYVGFHPAHVTPAPAVTDAAQSGGETPVAFERLIERGQAFANQVRHVTYLLYGQPYSSTVSELNAFDAALRHARTAIRQRTQEPTHE